MLSEIQKKYKLHIVFSGGKDSVKEVKEICKIADFEYTNLVAKVLEGHDPYEWNAYGKGVKIFRGKLVTRDHVVK